MAHSAIHMLIRTLNLYQFYVIHMNKAFDPSLQQLPACRNCQNLLMSDSSDTGFRCGLVYFSQPPRERKPIQYRNYPEVGVESICPEWRLKP